MQSLSTSNRLDNLNPICERCGLCCKGYTFWMTGKPYEEGVQELKSLTSDYVTFWMENRNYDEDPTEVKRLMRYHEITPIRRNDGILGMTVKRDVIELRRNARNELGIHISGDCNYLIQDEDGKYGCSIHETRPIVCREYHCEKIIRKALEKELNGVHI